MKAELDFEGEDEARSFPVVYVGEKCAAHFVFLVMLAQNIPAHVWLLFFFSLCFVLRCSTLVMHHLDRFDIEGMPGRSSFVSGCCVD